MVMYDRLIGRAKLWTRKKLINYLISHLNYQELKSKDNIVTLSNRRKVATPVVDHFKALYIAFSTKNTYITSATTWRDLIQ